MNTPQNQSPFRHLTSVAPGSVPPRPDSAALNRALWLQKSELEGLASAARVVIMSDASRVHEQEALCARLDRIATESRNLLEELQSRA